MYFQMRGVRDGVFVFPSCSLAEIRTTKDKYEHEMSKPHAGCFAERVGGTAPYDFVQILSMQPITISVRIRVFWVNRIS